MHCDVCGKTFGNKYVLQRHLLSDSHKIRLEQNELFVCHCGRKFQHTQGLYRHKKECNVVFCSICHVQFKRKQNIDHHLTTKKNKNRTLGNNFCVCNNCQSFLYSSGLSKNRNQCSEQDLVPSEICILIAQQKQEKDVLKQENEKMKMEMNEFKKKNIKQPHIKFFGCENLDYILVMMLEKISLDEIIPYIVKNVHFHKDHLENHNVKITNRKLPFASVYKDNKWELAEKRKTIEELIEKGLKLMDTRYKNIKLSEKKLELYQEFKANYKNKQVFKKIYHETELCILNNSPLIHP